MLNTDRIAMRVIGFNNLIMGVGVTELAFIPPTNAVWLWAGRDQQGSQQISYRFTMPNDLAGDAGQTMDVYLNLTTLMPTIWPIALGASSHLIRRSITAAASTITVLFMA